MASKFELSLSKDYVPGWGVVDAVRELFQNGLDQETQHPGNTFTYSYDPDNLLLTLTNAKSILETKTLLLGSSTKANDENTIGQFGEGYKVATLVLLREGKHVTFYNYGKKERWEPRFIKSRRYGAEILAFMVEKLPFWNQPPGKDLTITIDGITPEEYEQIKDATLCLQDPYDMWETPYGNILRNDQHKGKVFVNGLYVCNYDYAYGYDFQPKHIKLDRDRKLASSFDLKWLASKMWGSVDMEDEEMATAVEVLICKGSSDVEYVNDVSDVKYTSQRTIIASKTMRSFRETYGTKAVPVTSQEEAEQVKDTHKPIYVKEVHAKVLKESPEYIELEEAFDEGMSYSEQLRNWISDHHSSLKGTQLDELEEIVDAMEREGI